MTTTPATSTPSAEVPPPVGSAEGPEPKPGPAPDLTSAAPTAAGAATRGPSASGPAAKARVGGAGGRIRSGLAGAFGGLPRQFWIQWAGTLVNRAGTFVQPFLVLYLTGARGLGVQEAGVVIAVWGAGALASQLVGGWLADRIGRRGTMALGLLASAAALVGLGAARTSPTLMLAAFAVGITADVYRPASSALVADLVPAVDRPRAYGLLFWAVNIGFSVAAVSGGLLASRGYALLFAVDALTCAVFAVVIWFGVAHDTRPAPGSHAVGAPGYLSALRDPVLLGLLGLTLAYAVLYDQVYVALPLQVADAGLPTSAYGAVLAVNGIVVVLVQPFAATVLRPLSRTTVLAGASVLFGTGLALTALAHTRLALAGTVVVWTLGEVALSGYASTLVADLAPPAARGRYMGLFGLAFSASALIGPIVGTLVYARLGAGVLWTGCLVVSVATAGGHVLVGRAAQRRAL